MIGQAADGLRRLLLAHDLAWPAPLHKFQTIDSTNLWLKGAARAGATPWTVALAREQTAGRGRHGRQWLSPLGGLYLSVLLDLPPRVDATRPGVLALLAGVAVARALVAHGLAARLKWPNDVRVAGRKIAGLLVESVGPPGAPAFVLGIGVNLTWTASDIPEALRGRVTSLRMEGAASCQAIHMAARVLAELTVCYDALARQGAGAIVEQWRRLSEPWWGRRVEVHVGEQRLCGTVVAVAEDGALVLDPGDGNRCAVYAGEVEQLREQPVGDERHVCS